MKALLFLSGITTLGALAAHGQDQPPPRRDSLPVTELSEVVIAAPPPRRTTTFTLARVSVAEIESRNAASVADLATLVPAARIQTNSRGETLVYLRNAGERQIAVLFDGALLNVPWDYRVDMSLVPAGMVGGMSIAKGVPPVEYGTNVLGGAVNLASRLFERAARPRTELEFSGGSASQIRGAVSHRGSRGPLAYAASLGYSSTDGAPLPQDAVLPYSQPDPDLRTNSDARITNGFGRAIYHFNDGTELGLSVLHLDAEKGVAPESHKNPALSTVRFWRYPVWRSSQVILSGEGALDAGTQWKGALWANRFEQVIDQYTSQRYDTFDAREEDRDLTFGSRVVAQRHLPTGALKLAVNMLTSSHRQRDLDLQPGGEPAAGSFPALEYRQHVVSTGLEYEIHPANGVTITAGASYDAMFTPRTGDKPARDGFSDYSATLAALLEQDGTWFLRGAVGRKVRFPTMRELFGEALNRFWLNPDLEPESSILTEVAFGIRSGRLSGEIIPFGTFTSNTIDQRNVTVPGEPAPRRQRINLRGSQVLGIELTGAARPHDDLRVEGHLTLMHVRRLPDLPTDPIQLSEKPGALGRLAVSYEPAFGPRALVETTYTGRAYSLDDYDQFVPLARSLVLNLRLGYRFEVASTRTLEMFVRVDNAADQLVEPQLGLPAAGRSFQGGLKAEL